MNNLLLLVNIYLLFLHSPDPRTVQWPPVALNNILCLCVMVNMDWGSPHIPRQMKKKLHWYAPPTTYQMQVPLFLWRVLSQLLNLPASGCECYGSGKKKIWSVRLAITLHFCWCESCRSNHCVARTTESRWLEKRDFSTFSGRDIGA